MLKKLVRSQPTVSRRSGLFRDPSCTTGFQTFLTDRRQYSRWLTAHRVTLPPPLQLTPPSAQGGEGEEGGEEEDLEEEEEEEEEYDGKLID